MYELGKEKVNFPFKCIVGYDNGRDAFLVYRTISGKKAIRKFQDYPWYFAVESKHYERIKELESFKDVKLIKEDGYVRIYCPKDFDHKGGRDKLRDTLIEKGIVPLEFDLSLIKRLMIDNLIEIETNLKIGFFDIETDDSLEGIVIGRDRIISWAICDKEGDAVFYQDKDEKIVLEKFLEEINKYDVICGWNCLKFDIPYIRERMLRYSMNFQWKKIIVFDLMKRLIKLFGPMMTTVGLPGFSLQEVSQTFLNESKMERTEKIFELERDNLEKLKEYNIRDVLLLQKLDEKLSLFDLMIKECAWTGTFLNKFFVGELLDNYILREARKQGKRLPSQREWSKERTKVKGAYVMPPTKGMYDNIRVFDFKSLYPTIIVAWNISHDTILEKEENDCIKTPMLVDYNTSFFTIPGEGRITSNYFYSKKKGIYSDLIKYLLEMRKSYKKQQIESEYGSIEYNNSKAMQEVVKELSNCLYEGTVLSIWDKKRDEYRLMKIKELFKDSKEKYIESYNFNTKKIEWNKISHIVEKNYNGVLKKVNFYHSSSILCTPEHKFLSFEYSNYSHKNKNNRIVYKERHDNLKGEKHLLNQCIKETPVNKYKENTITIAKANSIFEEKEKCIDIREYDLKSIKMSKRPSLQIYYDKKRYRNSLFIKTNSNEFDNYISALTFKKLKSKKIENNKYRLIVPIENKMYDLLKQLSKESLKKYNMTIKLSSTSFELPIIIENSKELSWLLGFWLAEGCASWKIDKNSNVVGGFLITSSVEKHIKKYINILDKYSLKYKRMSEEDQIKYGGDKIMVNNSILAEIIIKDFYSSEKHNAYTKKIPSWIFNLKKEYIKEFIDGYSSGDGISNKVNRDRITTVSKDLSFQVSDLIRYVYKRPVQISEEMTKKGRIRYRIIYRFDKKKTKIFERFHDDITYEELKSIEDKKYVGKVYDIEVENAHNFFIGNILSKNSMYGITANPNSRFFDKRIAESITLTGQHLAIKTREILKEMGYETLYQDTDSLFVKIDEEKEIEPILKKTNEKLKEYITTNFNISEYIIELQYEKTFNPLILIDKKRYSGLMVDLDGKIVNKTFTRGIEVIKKDTIEFTRKKLIEMLDKILIEKKALPFFTIWLQNVKEEVLTKDLIADDLRISKKVSKPTYEYKKSKPVYVRLAEGKIKRQEILETQASKHTWGEKIEYIVTDSKGYIGGGKGGKTGMIAIEAKDFKGEWDREYYWNVQVFSVLYRVLNVVFPKYNWMQFKGIFYQLGLL